LTLVVLVILAACWAVVLVPPLLRARTERAGDPITEFNYRLGVLGQTNGALDMERSPQVRISRHQRAAHRRRQVLQVLAGGVAVTLLIAYVGQAPVFWALHALADVLLVAYLVLWAYLRSIRLERAEKVRDLHDLPAQRTPELAWRRAASS
jgi:hypothetical protein